MILRRFTEHIREQNWFAVGIDLLVVVIGIFLGLQVTDWNEARQERQIERQYIERLLKTTEENILLLEQHRELHSTLVDRTKEMLVILSKSEIAEADSTFVKQNLPLAFTWRNIDLNTGFVESLLSSGEWRIIRNPLLQELLPGVSAEAKALDRQLDYFRDWAVAFLPDTIYRNKALVDLKSISEFDHSSVEGADRTALSMWLDASDEELLTSDNRGTMTALMAGRLNFIGSIDKTLEKAKRLREVLQQEVRTQR